MAYQGVWKSWKKSNNCKSVFLFKKTLYCTLFGKLLQPEAIFRLKCIKAFEDRALPGPVKQSKAKEVFDEGAFVASMLSKLH